MMDLSRNQLLMIGGAILAVIAVVLYMRRDGYKREGYTRSCLNNDCKGLQRTPVDYAFKYPHGWQRNPHWKANPADKYQPLEYGPIDFFPGDRKLAANNGVLFQQYGQYWKGCGQPGVYLTNDEKNRFDLTNVGDYGARQQLDDMYSTRFGPRGISHTERTYDEPNPHFNKIYGGPAWLKYNDKLGD